MIQIEKFARYLAADDSEFLDHHTRRRSIHCCNCTEAGSATHTEVFLAPNGRRLELRRRAEAEELLVVVGFLGEDLGEIHTDRADGRGPHQAGAHRGADGVGVLQAGLGANGATGQQLVGATTGIPQRAGVGKNGAGDAEVVRYERDGRIALPARPIREIRFTPLNIRFIRRRYGGDPIGFFQDNQIAYAGLRRSDLARFDAGLYHALRESQQLDRAIPTQNGGRTGFDHLPLHQTSANALTSRNFPQA